MSDFLQAAYGAVSGDEFDETPVKIEEFVTDILQHPPLSEIQYDIVRASTQILREDTLINLYGEDEGRRIFKWTKTEVICALGKGCHAPETPIFNAKTGQWQRLDSLSTSPDNTVIGLTDGVLQHEYATESFYEGTGPMRRVETSLGIVEDSYVEHKYFA